MTTACEPEGAPTKRRKRGFQLLETMIVCMLLCLVGSSGVASLIQSFERYRLQEAGRAFSSEALRCRSQAVSLNIPLSLFIHESGCSYGISPPGGAPAHWIEFPPGTRCVRAPNRQVTFYSRGNAVPAGSFVFENRAGKIKVIISPWGRIRWEVLE